MHSPFGGGDVTNWVGPDPGETYLDRLNQYIVLENAVKSDALGVQNEFTPSQAAIWGTFRDNPGDDAIGYGSYIYMPTIVTGLATDDIVQISRSYYARSNPLDPWTSLASGSQYFVVNPYTPGYEDGTIQYYLTHAEDEGAAAGWTLAKGSWIGEDMIARYSIPYGDSFFPTEDQLNELVGTQYRMDVEALVYRGSTPTGLFSDPKFGVWRATGFTGGAQITRLIDSTDAMTITPEPGTLALLGLGLPLGLAWFKRRRAAH